ncbi:3-oxoacyl-[acyl-carrier-protein] reductase FabG [Candidatus Bealeia paramacronuclearis]|uniref:3-oxoacyl-[acyl-carrier-protein] reductase n=1 Tax=Candidatus Bealeia paramacronuclearis TaxID=1921001 RepID=A0ABZ2C4K5_9PROT|nr:3-oxoacyl-[acyl-carrier-protein] reductase FabG [Candidatus Bealeia paramacronuclearis]
MFRLDGKKALVTGASGGIGGAIAKALHTQGAHIILSGTRKDALETLAKELGGHTTVMPCDLSDPASTAELISKIETEVGGVDILVNNAGLTRDGLMMRMKDEDWLKVIEVNLTSAFRLSREAIRLMMKQRWGRIINITSIVGVTGNPGQANYAASKAGLIGFSKSLAQEVATRGITVNCLAPGFIGTPMTEVLDDKVKGKILCEIPKGEMGSPEDIAAGVVYLASHEAQYVTGQTLHINGGMVMV